MKKYFIPLLACLASLSVLSSCDFDAGKQEFDAMTGMYEGEMFMSLYTPDLTVEHSNRELASDSNNMLCTAKLDGVVGVAVDEDWRESVILNTHEYFDFQLPFLDEDGEVREIFRDGKLAHLYEGLKRAAADGYVSTEKMAQFVEMVRVIHDKIRLSLLSVNPVATMELGNVLTTYDPEQNSFYAPFTIWPTNFSRSSNMANALKLIQPELEMLNEKGLIDPESLETLQAIATQIVGGRIDDGSGYITSSLANDHFGMELHLEQATGLLDVLSTALYGNDANGKANRDLWIVFRFSGNWDGDLVISDVL